MTALTIAGLTLREASRRRVVWALLVLTVVLLALSAWGFSKLVGLDTDLGTMTSGEARLVASLLLNLIMFGMSLIAAIGTAFLAGPTLAGEVESGQALALLARPVRRSAVLLGKWLGLLTFGCGYVIAAGFAQLVVVRVTVGYWPPDPVAGLALLAAETVVLLTLALLLSSVVSTMASGIVGALGGALGNDGVERVGTVSRILLPTDGLWRGAMNAFQDPSALVQMGPGEGGFPFLSEAPLTLAYLAWAAVLIAVIWGLTALSFQRRDI